MRYMLLIVGEEGRWEQMSDEEARASMQAWSAYSESLVKAGAFVSGEGLRPSSTATTLRVEDGERLLTDGPFAETKEQVGGFYVIECRDLDEAIDWAAKLPSAQQMACEIRPVMDYEATGYDDPQATRQGAAS